MDLGVDPHFEPWCTPEEFARFLEERDDEAGRYELLNGRIVMVPPPDWSHSETSLDAGALLRAHVKAHGLGSVHVEMDILLPSGDVVRPDVCYFSHERAATAVRKRKHTEGVPDLVVEVLSPSTASRDRGEKKKKAIYQANGVREYWLADDQARTVTRFNLDGDRFGAPNVFTKADEFSSLLLVGLRFAMSEIYPEPRSP